MEKGNYIILMADIINSREANQALLMQSFKEVIHKINEDQKDLILSPLTITLGDEFQAIFSKLSDAIEVLISLEEKKILENKRFQLRYIIVEGAIETPINRKIAYEMLGEGLTRARTLLNKAKAGKTNYTVDLKDKARSKALEDAFLVFSSIKSKWDKEEDLPAIRGFLRNEDYKIIADALHKDRSQIWRKEKSLQISQYLAIRSVIKYIGGVA